MKPRNHNEKIKARVKNEVNDRTLDEETIMNESAHIADRDQLFGVDHKSFPPNTDAIYDDSWTDDTEKHLNDDRSEGKDFVIALRDLTPGSRPVGPQPNANETPTAAVRTGEQEEADEFELMSDKKLRDLANAMAIPERTTMTRHQMIEAVRSVGGTH